MVAKAGGADRLLAFIQTELIPDIDRRYRTTPFRILLGHSLGGLFVMHGFVSAPDLFRVWIALSPPAFWNGDEVIAGCVQLFSKHGNLKSSLFVSRAEREFDDTPRAFDKLNEALRLRAPASLRWQTKVIAGEDHGTSLLPAAQAGLEFAFLDWRLPSLVFDEGLDSSELYYRNLSAEYGFEVPIPEGEISALARQAASPQVRLRTYERYTTLYPQSITAFVGLAKSAQEAGNPAAAKDAYNKAYTLAIEENDPRSAEFKQSAESLSSSSARPR
jgi:pimeloyl-ACP methyl ester carboxylesterase